MANVRIGDALGARHHSMLGTAAATPAGTAAPTSSSIADENARPGTADWFVARPDQRQIAGYYGRQSYTAGEQAKLFVDSKGQRFDVQLYRMGYYAGLGARLVYERNGIVNGRQRVPTITDDTNKGAKLIQANWRASAAIPLPTDLPSGVYVTKLTREDTHKSSYAIFTMRATDPEPVQVVLPTNTWEAYNFWGGVSLYNDVRGGKHPAGVGKKASFLRPYKQDNGAGEFFRYDFPLISYLESRGVPVSYATDADVSAGHLRGPRTRLVIPSGHSEYHDMAERNAYIGAHRAGVDIAMFAGNYFCWRMRREQNGAVEVVYRSRKLDPVRDTKAASIRWEELGWQHNALFGAAQVWGTAGDNQHATNPRHWVWNGAGVGDGSDLGQLRGPEWDGVVLTSNQPRDVTVLSRAPLAWSQPVGAVAEMTIREPHDGSGFVFGGNQMGFNWSLAHPAQITRGWLLGRAPGRQPSGWNVNYPAESTVDPRMQRMVGNLIERATGIPNPEPLLQREPDRTAPLQLLSPVVPVPTAPGQMLVQFTEPPPGTQTVRVLIDGMEAARLPAGTDNVIVPGVANEGAHALRIEAIDGAGQVLKVTESTLDVRPAKSPYFTSVKRLWRSWGNAT